ncbi:MAG: hypothetical protein CMJ59_10740 [Planctomycetaceae bacterium]|nr:hypothetical protein [Planctomycetaceae bacterium]
MPAVNPIHSEEFPMGHLFQRREMLSLAGSVLGSAMLARPAAAAGVEEVRARYLQSILPTRDDVDNWLRGRKYPFAKYDPELGYLHIDRDFKEGLNRAVCRYRYDRLGARQMLAYADRPCRINTYGNSFTSCEQVSDGETWQEVLARHLCEPVRNYGIGGYSVYQSYLRMVREERRAPATTIIFNIFDDDHYRNILGWQRFKFGVNDVSINPTVPYMEVDPSKRTVVYHGNPCPDQTSVYRLTDLEWVTRTFKDNVYLASRLRRLVSSKTGKPVPPTDYDDETLNRYGLFATNAVIDKVKRYGEQTGRKILFVLSYGGYVVQQFIDTGRRFDQPMVDHLDKLKVPYVDLLTAHAADRKQFRTTTADYLRRFFVGHYNPLGNHFCAFAMVDPLVRMLDPKPASHGPATSVTGGVIK